MQHPLPVPARSGDPRPSSKA